MRPGRKRKGIRALVLATSTVVTLAKRPIARLYLPKDWSDDPQRCEKAGIPEEERGFKTKIDLAYEIILHQLELGTLFDYIGADGFYGNDCNLARKIDRLGLLYMLDIHSNQPVYLEKPELVLPEQKSNRGPKPKRFTVIGESRKVSEYIQGLDWEEWDEIKVRKTAKGTLKALFHFKEVYIWNKQENQIEKRLLVIRRMKTKSGKEIKLTEIDMIQLIYNRHRRRQHAINSCYLKEYVNLSK